MWEVMYDTTWHANVVLQDIVLVLDLAVLGEWLNSIILDIFDNVSLWFYDPVLSNPKSHSFDGRAVIAALSW